MNIRNHCLISPSAQIHPSCRIYSFVNIYDKCSVGEGSVIGAFVEIGPNVVIGCQVKVSSHAFICDGVIVEDDVFIGHGVMFINDLFSEGKPAGGKKELWKSTVIGNHVSIGSNATILPVTICDNVVIGAGSVVTKNIKEKGVYAGNPAQKIKEIL